VYSCEISCKRSPLPLSRCRARHARYDAPTHRRDLFVHRSRYVAHIGLVARSREAAIIVGHDWGANIAWHARCFRPDVFPAVAALSVPFASRSGPPLHSCAGGQLTHYWFHFQEPACEQNSSAIRARLCGASVFDFGRRTARNQKTHAAAGKAGSPTPSIPNPSGLAHRRGPRPHGGGIFAQRISGGLNVPQPRPQLELTAPWPAH